MAAGEEIRPGFQFIAAPGHRPGHAGVAIASSGERLLHVADIVGHSALLGHPTWAWPSDFAPEQARADRLKVLDRAVAEGALVFGSHLAFPGVWRVAREGAGWRLLPLRQSLP